MRIDERQNVNRERMIANVDEKKKIKKKTKAQQHTWLCDRE